MTVGGLPLQLTSFVGRETELSELAELVRSHRLATVSGAAGLGKTRLAIEVVRRLGEVGPDTVYYASLESLSDSKLVGQTIASSAGVSEQAGEALIETLARFFAGRPVLLVIDNCEHLADVCARMAEQLLSRCPALRVLATSRRPLRVPGEAVWRISPMSLPSPQETDVAAIASSESVRLFEARARLVHHRFEIGLSNACAVAVLCRRLDGVPLAIELAAARIEMMSVEDIVARLEDRLRLLVAGSSMTAPRHRSLQAALDWGHQLLDPAEQMVFRRTSVFAGGFDMPAAAAVCGGDGVDAEQLLTSMAGLVEKSLLLPDTGRAGPTRYRLLESVRQYGAERLEASDERDSMARKHAAHFLTLAEASAGDEHGNEHLESLERLESELDNFRAALEWDRAHDADAGLRLSGALAWFWVTRGHFTEGLGWLRGALAAAPGDSPARCSGLLAAARLSLWQGDYDSAYTHCCSCLDLCRRRGDDQTEAWALTLLGTVHTYRGEYEQAQARFDEVLSTAGDEHVRMEALVGLGEMLIHRGDLTSARLRLEEVSKMARGPDAPRGRAALFSGVAALFSGAYPVARSQCERALDIFVRLGNSHAAAGALDALAGLAMVASDPDRALRLCGAAAAIRASTGAQLAPRWREAVASIVIDPAFAALGDRAAGAWAEGKRMTLEEAVRCATGDAAPPRPAGGSACAATGPLAALTPRELEIAELVTAGLTNRQISQRLSIARRTVEGHVERLRGKLNVRSRTQVAVEIVRSRLSAPD